MVETFWRAEQEFWAEFNLEVDPVCLFRGKLWGRKVLGKSLGNRRERKPGFAGGTSWGKQKGWKKTGVLKWRGKKLRGRGGLLSFSAN